MIPTPTLFLPSTFVCAQGAGRLPGVPAVPPAQIGAANANRGPTGAQLLCHPVVGHSVGTTQHNADPKYNFLRRASGSRKIFQQFPFLVAKTQRLGSFPHAVHYTANLAYCNVTYETLH